MPLPQSQTPRTDSKVEEVMFLPDKESGGMGFGAAVPADFARQLERELNEARTELEKLKAAVSKLDSEYQQTQW